MVGCAPSHIIIIWRTVFLENTFGIKENRSNYFLLEKLMTITISGSNLTIEKLVQIARFEENVEIHPEALQRIKVCRAMVEQKIDAKEIMYGVNTGIGEFSEVVRDEQLVKEFQRYLIYNHAAGIGDPVPIEQVRAAMAGRINVHAHGNSGCRPEITLALVEMLNKGVTPVVCQKGSVWAFFY